MQNIYEYINHPKVQRQEHLDLDDYCIERGGNSTYSKALLAEYTGTTIPSGHMIHVCHACNNAKCSNPKHLYWGTASENRMDRVHFENRSAMEDLAFRFRQRRPS
jgi:hypothetical protein